MNVSLTPELEQLVQSKVQTGRYNSASEVMREALRLMGERDQVKAMQKKEIHKKIAAELKSLEEGRDVDGDTVFARLEAELDQEIRAEDERIALLEKDREAPFTPEQRAKLPGKLRDLAESIAALRAFQLVDGGSEPATVFHAMPPNSLPLAGNTLHTADDNPEEAPHD